MDTIRRVLLGPKLYELCVEKKATKSHLEERAQLLTKKIGNKCSIDDLIDICELKSTFSTECRDEFENKSLTSFNSLLESQTECPICFEDLDETYQTFGYCGHMFHKKCLDEWKSSPGLKNPGCPVCRGEPLPELPRIIECEQLEKDPKQYIYKASLAGRLDCVKWGIEKGYQCNEHVVSFAAENGYLDIVKYLVENGCPCDSSAAVKAVIKGNFEMLKYLIEKGNCECDVSVMKAAAQTNRLEMVKYLHKKGCKWNETVTASAAGNGHLTVLKYLHENGCPWDFNTLFASMIKGQLNTFIYAVENGCEGVEDVLETNGEVLKGTEILKYLKSKGWKKGIFSGKWSRS